MKTLKTFSIFILGLLMALNLAAQEKQVRNATGFSAIDVSEGIYVELTMGDKEYVEVIADDDIIDDVMTEVSGNELSIYIKGNNFGFKNRRIQVNVTAKAMKSIDASSGSTIETQNLIEAEKLSMSVSSGATIKVAFKALKASCKSSSGATARLKGMAKYFDANASSGSKIKADDVKALSVEADVSSGAHISITAEKELDAEASSGGSIKYSGSPKLIDIEKSSGGSVRKH
jgi:hypothetical protein